MPRRHPGQPVSSPGLRRSPAAGPGHERRDAVLPRPRSREDPGPRSFHLRPLRDAPPLELHPGAGVLPRRARGALQQQPAPRALRRPADRGVDRVRRGLPAPARAERGRWGVARPLERGDVAGLHPGRDELLHAAHEQQGVDDGRRRADHRRPLADHVLAPHRRHGARARVVPRRHDDRLDAPDRNRVGRDAEERVRLDALAGGARRRGGRGAARAGSCSRSSAPSTTASGRTTSIATGTAPRCTAPTSPGTTP